MDQRNGFVLGSLKEDVMCIDCLGNSKSCSTETLGLTSKLDQASDWMTF